MTNASLPVGLREFVSEHVDTYEQLETLLWFHFHRGEALALGSLAEKLGMAESPLREAVEVLVERRLLTLSHDAASIVRYEPSDVALDERFRLLASSYQQDRLQVIRLMTENSIRRLRSSTLQTFADCFLLGRPG